MHVILPVNFIAWRCSVFSKPTFSLVSAPCCLPPFSLPSLNRELALFSQGRIKDIGQLKTKEKFLRQHCAMLESFASELESEYVSLKLAMSRALSWKFNRFQRMVSGLVNSFWQFTCHAYLLIKAVELKSVLWLPSLTVLIVILLVQVYLIFSIYMEFDFGTFSVKRQNLPS